MRSIALCGALLIAAIVSAAAPAPAASVHAQATGRVWGTPAVDQETGSGASPVAAAAAYTRPTPPGDGAVAASASAAVGSLAAWARAEVVNAPGYLSATHYLYGATEAQGHARFDDRWTFSGRPLDTPGVLRLTVTFDGDSTGSATGADAFTYGQLNVSLLGLAEFDNVHDSATYASGLIPTADATIVLELDFLYGRPIVVNASLVAGVTLNSHLDVYQYSGGGESVFDQTAEFALLEVQDAGGPWSTSYALTTESSGTYPFEAPEPAGGEAALAACLALAGVTCRESAARRSARR